MAEVSGETETRPLPTIAGGAAGRSNSKKIKSKHFAPPLVVVEQGVRSMKGYTVTKHELFELGGGGVVSSICFSAAGTYFNSAKDGQRSLDLAAGLGQKVPEEIFMK